jgi:N-acetylglucosamine kinase-like BadF-type ATPase
MKNKRRAFIGIDGGGSKTLAVVIDEEGHELGRGFTASSNQACVGIARAAARICDAAAEAAQQAGVSPPFDAACLGLAGVDRPDDRDAVLRHLGGLAREIRIGNDGELILGALDGGIGMAVIVGTGSIALGRDASGRSVRAGGWGHVMGDEGSGYDLGQRVLRHAVRAADHRGPQTRLLDLVMQHFGLEKPSDLTGRVYPAEDKAAIARLAHLVFQAAEEGDHIAHEMLERGSSELALMVATAAGALEFDDGKIPLALSGSIALHVRPYRDLMLEKLRARVTIGEVKLVDCPALGAAQAARRAWLEKHSPFRLGSAPAA